MKVKEPERYLTIFLNMILKLWLESILVEFIILFNLLSHYQTIIRSFINVLT